MSNSLLSNTSAHSIASHDCLGSHDMLMLCTFSLAVLLCLVYASYACPGHVQLLAGQPSAKKGVIDGPRDTATFNQPRGICKEESTGQLIVVDGVGSTAVLCTVATSGQDVGASLSQSLSLSTAHQASS
jgi:hypothetical protein